MFPRDDEPRQRQIGHSWIIKLTPLRRFVLWLSWRARHFEWKHWYWPSLSVSMDTPFLFLTQSPQCLSSDMSPRCHSSAIITNNPAVGLLSLPPTQGLNSLPVLQGGRQETGSGLPGSLRRYVFLTIWGSGKETWYLSCYLLECLELGDGHGLATRTES